MSDCVISPSLAREWSAAGALTMTFSKSRGAGYHAALTAAKRADQYAERLYGPKVLHVVGFGRSKEQFELALFVIHRMCSSSTLLVFHAGKPLQNHWEITEILECIVTANSCTDARAHCVVVVDEDRLALGPPPPTSFTITIGDETQVPDHLRLRHIGTRTFPCRYLVKRLFKFQPGHPSSEADQIQAGAVRAGCDWCPHLRVGHLALPSPDE